MGWMGVHGQVNLDNKMLDRDHREIFENICEIQDLFLNGRNPTLIVPLLHTLERRCRVHFALEEGMMMSTRYPQSAHHLLSHLGMMESMQKLESRFERGDLTRVRDAMNLLTDSHLDHVGGADLQYQLWLDVPQKRELHLAS
ncbi:MAG TPA: hemerythrin family protein [Acidobacteriaceae bacterium]|jgi:hemerythrin-like metal-binding protein|nr:hemerythrin family protein [Acidobacteriaceae bacterium]